MKYTIDRLSGCWVWTGARYPYGYGRLSGNTTAHRLSYEFYFGEIPDGLFVLHRCDNPPCVNPEHLFLGTQGDNMRDRNAKGRQALGKLTLEQRAAIRNDPRKLREIAKDYGVSHQAISLIKRRVTWNAREI